MYREIFGKDAADVSLPELLQGLGKWEQGLDKDPQKRPFAHLQRDADGKLPDDGLVEILTSSIEDISGKSYRRWIILEGWMLMAISGAFGANNIPKALKAVTILGMQQARNWNLASLNEFRKFFQLKPHDTFEAINSDPIVADQLKYVAFARTWWWRRLLIFPQASLRASRLRRDVPRVSDGIGKSTHG